MFRKTWISWLQLKHQKAQTLSAALGITFITVLLFMQIGFRSSFLNTLLDLPASFNADVVMVNSSAVTVLRTPTFSQLRLNQTLAFEEVERVAPVYWSSILMRDPEGGEKYLRKVQAIGLPLTWDVMLLDAVHDQYDKLKIRRNVLIDAKSKDSFSQIINTVQAGEDYSIEVRSGRDQSSIRVTGLFEVGVSQSANSHIITSDATFIEAFNRSRNQINVGLIQLRDGADPATMAERMNTYLPSDVKVVALPDLLKQERAFYEFQTPIGIIFRFGLGGAVAVGIVILYQILFQLISKYIRDFATLKAIGFSNGQLRRIVLGSALMLAVLGFLPGLGLSFVMYDVIANATALKFEMTWEVSLIVFGAIAFICVVSALLAIRKLNDADPADLFG
ncbi:FtsX-like permease family protein [Shimia abyssi]|uniref:Putative ABC transport system permease protein n=1 Tax=Shimia abyssi TaxID=1662395 RepID=A0A2P8FFP4_9RHOB|nr:FtsX-like permease family protein [Shimia abyssi]PSL20539.1 putative ABC transport system permease protein [Shimia abyssi]